MVWTQLRTNLVYLTIDCLLNMQQEKKLRCGGWNGKINTCLVEVTESKDKGVVQLPKQQ